MRPLCIAKYRHVAINNFVNVKTRVSESKAFVACHTAIERHYITAGQGRSSAISTVRAASVLMTSSAESGVTPLPSLLVVFNGHQEGRHRITPGCPSSSPLTATAPTTPLTARSASQSLTLACRENGRIAVAAAAAVV